MRVGGACRRRDVVDVRVQIGRVVCERDQQIIAQVAQLTGLLP